MKSLEYYVNEIKTKNLDGGYRRTKAYPFIDDSIVIVKKIEEDFEIKKEIISKLCAQDINIPNFYESKKIDGEYWIMEDLAPGTELASLLNIEDNLIVLDKIPYEHIEKYIHDVYVLESAGIGIEPKRKNIFYDDIKGFTTIDVAYMKNKRVIPSSSLEEMNDFFSMFYPVFRGNVHDTKEDKILNEKIVLKVLKAFNNAILEFNEYSRWIYRGFDDIVKVLNNTGYDLTLTLDEKNELQQLIEKFIDKKVNNAITNKLGYDQILAGSYGYIGLLESSLNYVDDYNPFENRLEDYIKKCINNQLKNAYLSNRNDKYLISIYKQIRVYELNLLNMYDYNEILKMIEDEISDLTELQNKTV